MNFLISILFILFSFKVSGQAIVHYIHSPSEIMVELQGVEGFSVGQKVIIISKDKDTLIGIGIIKNSEIEGLPDIVKVEVIELIENYLIMPEDSVHLLDFDFFENNKIPGFFSLTLEGNQKTPAKYKELAYYGVFTSDGHPLVKNETLVSPFQIQYGVTDKFTARIVNALWLDGYANVGAKFSAYKNKYTKISVNALGAYKLQAQDWIGQVGGLVTVPSNSKFQSHFMINITFDPQYENAKATKGLGLFSDSDIRGINEYITDNWNRILYGPVYNVELQTFGGTISHMWIWDTFHMSLGLATKDFSNLAFETEGYYVVYDLFWRF